MRGLFGGQFVGQAATFVYLTQASQSGPAFDIALWPQFSIYNFLIANFWPLYWIGFAIDRAKVKDTYWHVFAIAHDRAGDVFHLMQLMVG